jgi:AraC family transcriptional regulator, transcriptional activator FtrA
MMIIRENVDRPPNRLVVVMTYNGLCTFEFGLAVEVFGLARPEFDFSWYRFAVAAAEDRKVHAIGGMCRI